MTEIVVLYHSIHGRTEVVAKCIYQGAAPVESVESEFIAPGAEEVTALFY
jgi:flavodoxin